MTSTDFGSSPSNSSTQRFTAMGVQTYDRNVIRAAPDLNSGENHPSIIEVQNYLRHYGYLTQDAALSSGQLDDATVHALTTFQQRFNINPSGNLDATTRAAMTASRCGVPDIVSPLAFRTAGAWNRRNLTYAFGPLSVQLSNDVVQNAVRRAFNTWAATGTELTFTEVAQSQNPDILIEWRQAEDPDHSMVGGILAHADFPPGFSRIVSNPPLPLHFDDQEHTWVDGAVSNGFDIETLALHEIGHCLGMHHTDVVGSVMFATIKSNSTLRTLQPDDLEGIRNLYPTTPTYDRYIGVWEQSGGATWVARHGLTSAQYQAVFEELAAKGYRPTILSGYSMNGQDFYLGVWEQSGGATWVARHGLTSAQYQAVFEELAAKGYRPTILSGYSMNGQDFYLGVWEQSGGATWVARHGLTSAQY
ncbi:MAG: matrixin family metalloprotease, partial [Trichocoleus desertorum ATA4-8-CV12]|nr:matrixin family metalloprotease [Trichocoleus desertorum ATA4-8-CV12]